MKLLKTTLGAIALCGFISGTVSAQSWDTQQTAVWQAVAKTWDMDQKQDDSWISEMTTANVSGWSMSNPAPRGRDSLVRWSKLNRENSKMLAFELSPLSIAVSGGAAVAHYYYSSASENKEGKRETEHGYCSDVLVKQGDGWTYLGWNCGKIPAMK